VSEVSKSVPVLAATLVQAVFTLLALGITRWSFRWWPEGAYVAVPLALDVAGLLVVGSITYTLARRGVPLSAILAAWLGGRLLGVLAASLVPGVGIDAALVASASFGLLDTRGEAVSIGVLRPWPLVAHLAVLIGANGWGRR